MTTPILIIGAGKMGTAMIRGWVKAGLGPITAVEPHPSQELQRSGVTVVSSLEDAPSGNWHAVVVAMKPHIIRAEVDKLASLAATGAMMISVAAGTSTAFFQAHWGDDAAIVRVMPNTPGSIGRGVSGLYATPCVSQVNRDFAGLLMSSIGEIAWLETEALIDSVTAISGSGPAYIFALVEAMTKAGEAVGLTSDTAARLARATVTGAGALLDADPRSTKDLIRDVATPGGTTEAALRVLQADDGLPGIMTKAAFAAKTRAEEMAKS